MAGFDRSRILGMNDQVLDEFICGICQGVFNNPVVTQCCRTTYCGQCIEQWLNNENTCPNDRQPLRRTGLHLVPRFVNNLLNNMQINCQFNGNGCQVMTTIGELSNHLKSCKYVPRRVCIENSILNHFEICSKIADSLVLKLKYFFAIRPDNAIFITEDDKVYGLGDNKNGLLGLGHTMAVSTSTEIEELSNRNIVDIIVGSTFVLGRNNDNKLFGWGSNDIGQLAIGSVTNDVMKPRQIAFFDQVQLNCISSGWHHTLASTADGGLYGWGGSYSYELVYDMCSIHEPTKLNIFGKNNIQFDYVYCCGASSFAVTKDRNVFSWGKNERRTLGQSAGQSFCRPQMIDISGVRKICSNGVNTYFLTTDGSIHFCGDTHENEQQSSQLRPKKMEQISSIIDLPRFNGFHYQTEIFCCDSDNGYHKLKNNQSVKLDDKFESIGELYAQLFGFTLEMITISK